MEATAGIVLAGGLSRRMGGGDKSLLDLGRWPLLAHVLARLGPQVARIAISANGDPLRFARFGLPVVGDRIEGFHGPLAGVEAGLTWVRETGSKRSSPEVWAVTVPGDTPFIPSDLVKRLAAAADGDRMAVATSAAGLHPVVGVWPVSMAGALAEAIARGERRASYWVKSHGAVEVFFEPVNVAGEEVDPFFNINAPEDLSYARDLLARTPSSV